MWVRAVARVDVAHVSAVDLLGEVAIIGERVVALAVQDEGELGGGLRVDDGDAQAPATHDVRILMRVCPIAPLRKVGDIYVQIFRNIAGISLLVFFYYAFPYLGILWDERTCVILVVVLVASAFGSENFMAYVTDCRVEFRKLYPEQSCESTFAYQGRGDIYACCNRHGLFRLARVSA